jgi:hypothetical protein
MNNTWDQRFIVYSDSFYPVRIKADNISFTEEMEPQTRFSLMELDYDCFITEPIKEDIKVEEPKEIIKFPWSDIKLEPMKDVTFIIDGDKIYEMERPDYFKKIVQIVNMEFEK